MYGLLEMGYKNSQCIDKMY